MLGSGSECTSALLPLNARCAWLLLMRPYITMMCMVASMLGTISCDAIRIHMVVLCIGQRHLGDGQDSNLARSGCMQTAHRVQASKPQSCAAGHAYTSGIPEWHARYLACCNDLQAHSCMPSLLRCAWPSLSIPSSWHMQALLELGNHNGWDQGAAQESQNSCLKQW